MTMKLLIKESTNSDGLLTIHNGVGIKFAHFNTNTGKVSILNSPIAKQIERLNGTEILKKAIEEEVAIWKYEKSPLRKLTKDQVLNLTEILASMSIIASALDTAIADLNTTCSGIDIGLDDVETLKDTSVKFIKNASKGLGIDASIVAFDFGEEIYNASRNMAKEIDLLNAEKNKQL